MKTHLLAVLTTVLLILVTLPALAVPIADGFDYPVGPPDGDGYNHTAGWDFLDRTDGGTYHPGEDWNQNGTSGDGDLDQPVYAVANGTVTAADDYHDSWGNIVVIEHLLPDGTQVWSLYGHLDTILVSSGDVTRGQQIGTIGKGYVWYAHIHFEIRKENLPPDAYPNGWSREQVQAAYARPSEFIDSHRWLGPSFVQLTNFTDTGSFTNPVAISGDGSRILFGRGQNTGDVCLWGVNGDGSGLHQITSADTASVRPRDISADGTRIVFVSHGDPTGENPSHVAQIFAVNWDGTGLRQFPGPMPYVDDGDVCISGDGTKVIFTGGRPNPTDVWVVNWDGTGLARVTDNQDGTSGIPAIATNYYGDVIACSSSARLDGEPTPYGGVLWAVNSDGSGLRRLFEVPVGGTQIPNNLTLSDDGSRIAFACEGVYVTNTDGTGLRELVTDGYYPSMNGAGSHLAFTSSAGGLWTVNADGTNLSCLVPGWNSGGVVWYGGNPYLFRFSRDGSYLAFPATNDLTGQNPQHAEQVFLAGLGPPPDSPRTVPDVQYPTEDEWTSATWHPHWGQLHAHRETDVPGDDVSPGSDAKLLEKYQQADYDFLAITEHQMNLDHKFNDTTWASAFVDPGVEGIVSLVGSVEDTANDTHILAAGFDSGIHRSILGKESPGDYVGASAVREERLRNITSHGGLAYIAHPDCMNYWWNPRMLKDLYQKDNTLYNGIELYNAGAATAAYLLAYKDELLISGDQAAAQRAGRKALEREGFALDTWAYLLGQGVRVHGIVGDDYHLGEKLFFADTSVTAWTEHPEPNAAEIEDALRAGRFYASFGSPEKAPQVLAYWGDAQAGTISVQVPKEPADAHGYRVLYTSGRPGRPSFPAELVNRGDGSYVASYPYRQDDVYVLCAVIDNRGYTSWLQPIWIGEIQTKVGVLPAGGALRAAAVTPTLEMEGGTLNVSSPQSGITEVTGTLLNGDDRPPAPPMGYLSRCYQFTPEVALAGANSLTIAYFRDLIRGFPASDVAIYHYDQAGGTWQRLPSTVDDVAATVTAAVSELGIYTVSVEEPADVGDPVVAITSLVAGDTITAPTIIAADASDDQGVANVHFYLDGWPLADDTWGEDGWIAKLDPANFTAGERVLSAVAEDGVGNETSTEITVNIAGLMLAPAITISGPAEAQVLWGDVQASGSWSGELPMSLAVFTIDDEPLTVTPGVDTSWNLDVPIPEGLAGDRTFTATGFDMYGNRAEAAVNVTLRVFSDVPLGFWARDHIYATARAGIVQGYPDGLYHPEFSVTRDQMAVYIARAIAGGDASVPDPGCSTPVFTDVPCDQWARKYVQFCVSHGVVQGYEDGSYHPTEEVDRAQMAVYVARALVAPAGEAGLATYVPADPRNFPDVPSTFWAYKHVEYCVENGVVQGYDDGYYHPEIIVTRDQMAVYVARAFQLPI